MLKALLTGLSLFVYVLSAKANTTCLQDPYWKPQRIVLAVYGNDCVNCYIALAKTYSLLKQKHAVTFVYGEVPIRLADTFTYEKLGTLNKGDTIIKNTDFFNCINPGITSALILIENHRIQTRWSLKNITHETIHELTNHKAVIIDSLDITSYAGNNASGINITGNSLYITNDLKATTYQLTLTNKSVINTYHFKNLEDSFPLLIQHNVNLSEQEKQINIRDYTSIKQLVGSGISVSVPYFTETGMYVPLTVRIKKAIMRNGDTLNAIMPSQYLVKLNNDLSFRAVYSFPYQVEGHPNLYNITEGGYVKNDTFYSLCNSANNDSLLVVYSLKQSPPALVKVYNLSYPTYFPLKNPATGNPMRYLGLFTTIDNKTYFMFNVAPVIYNITSDSLTLKELLNEELFSNGKPLCWIDRFIQTSDKAVMFLSIKNEGVYAHYYNLPELTPTDIRKIADDGTNVVGVLNNKVYYTRFTDDKVWLYAASF
ncbi:MAG: hypothetical protein KIS94_12335 [Chitinophagales bacterium]|nr:hypothetical protein [Chitinophagales bacterium]